MVSSSNVEAFRAVMRRIASTVAIIATQSGERPAGLAVTTLVSLSFEPASILFCMNNTASAYSAITEAHRFSASILRADQCHIADQFGRSENRYSRFADDSWYMKNGLPVLRRAQATLFCEKVRAVRHGSHDVIIGDVLEAQFSEAVDPLIYVDGGVMALAGRD